MKSSLNVNVQEIKSMIRALAEESKLEKQERPYENCKRYLSAPQQVGA